MLREARYRYYGQAGFETPDRFRDDVRSCHVVEHRVIRKRPTTNQKIRHQGLCVEQRVRVGNTHRGDTTVSFIVKSFTQPEQKLQMVADYRNGLHRGTVRRGRPSNKLTAGKSRMRTKASRLEFMAGQLQSPEPCRPRCVLLLTSRESRQAVLIR